MLVLLSLVFILELCFKFFFKNLYKKTYRVRPLVVGAAAVADQSMGGILRLDELQLHPNLLEK